MKWNEWSEPVVINKHGEIYWLVKVIYRAKNSFGAYGIGAGAAYIRNDVVVYSARRRDKIPVLLINDDVAKTVGAV